jgi:hypothetical protein
MINQMPPHGPSKANHISLLQPLWRVLDHIRCFNPEFHPNHSLQAIMHWWWWTCSKRAKIQSQLFLVSKKWHIDFCNAFLAWHAKEMKKQEGVMSTHLKQYSLINKSIPNNRKLSIAICKLCHMLNFLGSPPHKFNDLKKKSQNS